MEKSELPEDHPTRIILNKICGENYVNSEVYSEKNIKKQMKLINELETGFAKYNMEFNDVKITEIVPIFFSMISFAHPIIIKYMKEKSCIGEHYTYNNIEYDVKKEVKEILEYLYVCLKYDKVSGNAGKEEYQTIINDYAKLFNVEYGKINYD